MLAWKGVFSAKFRTGLTLLGVALGTFALTTMGSMTVHFHAMATRFNAFLTDKLFIRDRSGFFGGGVLDEQELKSLSGKAGLKRVIPVVVSRLRSHEVVVFGLPQIAIGVPLSAISELFKSAPLVSGRWPQHDNECLLGADIALQPRADNKTFIYQGKAFQIAGVMGRTNGPEDREAVFSLSAMQHRLGREGIVSYGIVIAPSPADLKTLAASLEAAHPHWEVIPPEMLSQELHQNEMLWNALTLGTGFLAALIGGIGILMSLMMAAQERTRDIAISKSLGASHFQIALAFFMESVILAFFGSGLGFLGAFLFITQTNARLVGQGIMLFEPSFRLLGLTFVFALLLAILGGVYPAIRAARIQTAEALRR